MSRVDDLIKSQAGRCFICDEKFSLENGDDFGDIIITYKNTIAIHEKCSISFDLFRAKIRNEKEKEHSKESLVKLIAILKEAEKNIEQGKSFDKAMGNLFLMLFDELERIKL